MHKDTNVTKYTADAHRPLETSRFTPKIILEEDLNGQPIARSPFVIRGKQNEE